MVDAASMSKATHKLASIPVHGKWDERRYVLLSIEKSPVTKRQTLNCRSHESNIIAPRSTNPKARAGAVYSPATNEETSIAIAK
jgi:hypothetical protein